MKRLIILWFALLWAQTSVAEQPLTTLLRDLAVLSSDEMSGRKTGTLGAEKSREYLFERFNELGLKPLEGLSSYAHSFTASTQKEVFDGVNVVGQRVGNIKSTIVVSAHYDHLGRKGRRVFNGADDNASGVAAMLELAHRATANSLSCRVVFLASDAEEHGLLGARAFVKDNLVNLDRVFANLNLDMLSQPGGRKALLVSGNASYSEFPALITQVESNSSLAMLPTDLRRRVGRYPLATDRTKVSDHAAFAEVGIPFLFLGVGKHSYYHTPRDTFSRVNQAFYATTVNAAWLYLQGLDELCLTQFYNER